MEQQLSQKEYSRVDKGRGVASEIGGVDKSRSYRILYGEGFSGLSEATTRFWTDSHGLLA